eukprot:1152090-Pelagomonas_calceolata.AAC.2
MQPQVPVRAAVSVRPNYEYDQTRCPAACNWPKQPLYNYDQEERGIDSGQAPDEHHARAAKPINYFDYFPSMHPLSCPYVLKENRYSGSSMLFKAEEP